MNEEFKNKVKLFNEELNELCIKYKLVLNPISKIEDGLIKSIVMVLPMEEDKKEVEHVTPNVEKEK